MGFILFVTATTATLLLYEGPVAVRLREQDVRFKGSIWVAGQKYNTFVSHCRKNQL